MKFSDLIKKQVVVEKLEMHETLNPLIWDEFSMKADVKKAMNRVADAFVEFLKVDKSLVKDIVFTGSNCNYNFHSNPTESDLDIHIELDTSKFTCMDYADYLITKKTLWNLQHNISIKKIPVELYAEQAIERTVEGAGVYSLKNDKWIVEPKPIVGEIQVDQPNIDRKVKSIKQQIDDIIKHNVDDIAIIDRLKDNIKNLRKTGIEKDGEFSTNNLAFKQLRDDGYLEKLSNYKDNLNDTMLGLK